MRIHHHAALQQIIEVNVAGFLTIPLTRPTRLVIERPRIDDGLRLA
jgi:hypothetical protein